MSRNDSAHAKVWVGRVKSNVAPEFLETAFQKIGKLIKVETGFAGVAFVDFVHEDDADAAVKELHKQFVPNIGEILVSRATQRGYESACQKRDIYQRSKGKVGEVYHCGDRGSRGLADEGRRSRSRSRSRSKSRSRSRSRGSRSGSPKRQRNSRSRSHQSRGRSRSPSRRSRSKSAGSKSKRSASRPRSPSKRRSPSKSNVQLQPREDQAEPAQEDRRSKSPESRHSSKSPEPREKSKSPEARRSPSPEPAPPAEAKMAREPLARPEPSVKKKLADDHGQTKVDSALRKCQDLLAVPSKVIEEVVPVTQDPYAVSDMSAEAPEQRLACHSSSSSLSLQERAAVVQFFDGASVRELLLESAAVVAVPDLFLPEMMNGFPHSFQSLSQDGVINLLAVFAAFVRGGGAGAHAAFDSDLSVEVRQTLTVNAQGRRVMRKTLLVDGIRCASEEQAL